MRSECEILTSYNTFTILGKKLLVAQSKFLKKIKKCTFDLKNSKLFDIFCMLCVKPELAETAVYIQRCLILDCFFFLNNFNFNN